MLACTFGYWPFFSARVEFSFSSMLQSEERVLEGTRLAVLSPSPPILPRENSRLSVSDIDTRAELPARSPKDVLMLWLNECRNESPIFDLETDQEPGCERGDTLNPLIMESLMPCPISILLSDMKAAIDLLTVCRNCLSTAV